MRAAIYALASNHTNYVPNLHMHVIHKELTPTGYNSLSPSGLEPHSMLSMDDAGQPSLGLSGKLSSGLRSQSRTRLGPPSLGSRYHPAGPETPLRPTESAPTHEYRQMRAISATRGGAPNPAQRLFSSTTQRPQSALVASYR